MAVQRRAVLLGTATAFALPAVAALAANECTDFQTAPSGIQWCEVVEGTGEPPVKGARIRAHYRGSLESGAVFDSSYERGRPLIFQVGVGQVIKGEGVGFHNRHWPVSFCWVPLAMFALSNLTHRLVKPSACQAMSLLPAV